MIECRDCDLANTGIHGTYKLGCFECRKRFLLSEPCKLMRQILAEGVKKYGDLPEWMVEPSCGCINHCKRRQSIRQLNVDYKYAN
jgi:hypothetical protein